MHGKSTTEWEVQIDNFVFITSPLFTRPLLYKFIPPTNHAAAGNAEIEKRDE